MSEQLVEGLISLHHLQGLLTFLTRETHPKYHEMIHCDGELIVSLEVIEKALNNVTMHKQYFAALLTNQVMVCLRLGNLINFLRFPNVGRNH